VADGIRLSVASGGRRADLVLPGGVPVVELLPELARGLLGTTSPTATLTWPAGAALDPDVGLVVQGVADGVLLWLTATPAEPPVVYDDARDALADLGPPSRGGRRVRALALRRAERRQGDGPVDVLRLRRELRALARLQLLATLCVVALLAGAAMAWFG
jgi:hypothetical protein